MRRIATRVREWYRQQLEGFFGQEWTERSVPGKAAAAVAALTVLTTQEVIRDRGPMMAAGLAFFTVLAIVPLLTVAASLMMAFGLLEQEGGRVFDTLHRLFPDVASGLASYLSQVATESAQAIGGIGAATLLVIGLVLFNYIEESLTQIWRGAHDRSYVVKMLTFWAMLTFGPVLIALSIVQTARAQIFLAEMGLSAPLMTRMAPLVYALVAFTLLIKLVPNADIQWRAALVGGLFTAVSFELAKWGFNVYVNQLLLQTYDRVYGTLALIPIGLIWVYITWLLILIGAELAYSFQYMRELLRAEAGRRSSEIRPEEFRTLHPMVPFEVLAAVLRGYQQGDGPVEEREIVDETNFPGHVVGDVIDHLEKLDVLVEVGVEESRRLVPARPPEAIELGEIVDSFWVPRRRECQGEVGRVSEQYLEVSRAFFDEYTGRALLGGDDGPENEQPAGRPPADDETDEAEMAS